VSRFDPALDARSGRVVDEKVPGSKIVDEERDRGA
jgi:hypothetical protein